MTGELTGVKKKYLKQKKRERLRREQETGEVIIFLIIFLIFIQMKALSFQINVRDKKFCGGGFNLAV